MDTPIVVETGNPNVKLRQLTVEDAPAYFDAVEACRAHLSQFGDETAGKYPDLQSVVDSIANPKNPDKIRMGIWDDGIFVGSVNLTPDSGRGDAELGYWVDSRYAGRGYATLAARALAKFGQARYKEIWAGVDIRNKASARVLEKAGFKRTAAALGKLLFTYYE
jgi:RimJ/RimL family protein N-acetyltransferase